MINKKLTLSLVIPVFNEEDYLADCLNSIAGQMQKPDEVIVVDNGSSDRSVAIAGSYPFVKLLHQPQRGVVYARNSGFNAAKFDLIGRIDADTVLAKDWVANVKASYFAAGSPKLYAATSASLFRNRYAWFWYVMHRLTYFWPSRGLLGHTALVGSNMVMTKRLWRTIKNDVCGRTDIHEDMDLAYHAHKTNAKIEFYKYYKASVVARQMRRRLISYPTMMFRLKFINH